MTPDWIPYMQLFDVYDATQTSLNLGFQNLITLPLAIFDNLIALTTLLLTNNAFAMVPPEIFDNLTALSSLDLSSNQIVTLPSGIFDNLTALNYLDLNSNQIVTLPSGIFDNLTALNYLGLGNNYLTESTVNQVLHDFATNILPHVSSGTLNLSGGTSAPPTGQGIIDMNALITSGWTVTVNNV